MQCDGERQSKCTTIRDNRLLLSSDIESMVHGKVLFLFEKAIQGEKFQKIGKRKKTKAFQIVYVFLLFHSYFPAKNGYDIGYDIYHEIFEDIDMI